MATAAAALHNEFAKQAERLSEIPELESRKAEILTAAETEDANLDESVNSLAKIDAKISLIRHGVERRGTALSEEFPALRGKMIELKRTVLNSLSAGQREQIAIRQDEVRKLLSSWGGTAPDPSAYIAAIGPVVASCPVIKHLESLRKVIDAWNTTKPAHALLRVADSAADVLADLDLPDSAPGESGESELAEPNALLAWTPGRKGWDLISVHSDKMSAENEFHALEQFTAINGYLRFTVLNSRGPARVDRFPSAPNLLIGEKATDRTAFREKGYHGPDERFLNDSAQWLAPT